MPIICMMAMQNRVMSCSIYSPVVSGQNDRKKPTHSKRESQVFAGRSCRPSPARSRARSTAPPRQQRHHVERATRHQSAVRLPEAVMPYAGATAACRRSPMSIHRYRVATSNAVGKSSAATGAQRNSNPRLNMTIRSVRE